MTSQELFQHNLEDDTVLRRVLDGFSGPSLARCALLLKLGQLEAAHQLAQEDESELGSYWHGIMHRVEGDLGNARYWFRRAGSLPQALGLDPIALTNGSADPAQLDEEWKTLLRYTLDGEVTD